MDAWQPRHSEQSAPSPTLAAKALAVGPGPGEGANKSATVKANGTDLMYSGIDSFFHIHDPKCELHYVASIRTGSSKSLLHCSLVHVLFLSCMGAGACKEPRGVSQYKAVNAYLAST